MDRTKLSRRTEDGGWGLPPGSRSPAAPKVDNKHLDQHSQFGKPKPRQSTQHPVKMVRDVKTCLLDPEAFAKLWNRNK